MLVLRPAILWFRPLLVLLFFSFVFFLFCCFQPTPVSLIFPLLARQEFGTSVSLSSRMSPYCTIPYATVGGAVIRSLFPPSFLTQQLTPNINSVLCSFGIGDKSTLYSRCWHIRRWVTGRCDLRKRCIRGCRRKKGWQTMQRSYRRRLRCCLRNSTCQVFLLCCASEVLFSWCSKVDSTH